MEWYCFRTERKREHIAAANVESEVGLDVYCPRISSIKKTRRGRVRYIEAMFTSYIFILADLDISLSRILHTQGIQSVPKYGRHIPAIPSAFIDELRQEIGGDILVVKDPEFKELEEVRIEEGPFAGVIAKIVNTNSSTDRLNLMIGILGQDVGVSIPRECVARI